MTKKADKKPVVKQMTLRQQLRAQAAEKLGELEQLVSAAMIRVLEEADVEVNAYDVMRLCLGGQTKTVREQLITDLANNAEAKLLKMWNDQQNLDLGDKDGD